MPEPLMNGNDSGENEHPRGALLLIVLYLTLTAAAWLNAYLHLWSKGWPR